ncbi:MAG: LysR family transcriptional regulator [Rhodobacteraceae bacterium]|nr:LysR family transcriptional regulator [Paracoccaceae bacterium]
MAIKIEMLRCFASVASKGNLADAAAELGRSPSAVSMMLKQLQDHLGEPLFKTDRKNELSELGTFVFEQAQQELLQFEGTIRAIEQFASGSSGLVRVAAVPSAAETIMPAALQGFLDRHPNVQIELRDMDSRSVMQALEQGRVDIGIGSGGGADTRIDRRRLMSDVFGLVCPADHPLASNNVPLDWLSLKPYRLIANGLSGTIQNPVFQEIHADATLTVRNTISLLAMVRAGLGFTVLPGLVLRQGGQGLAFVPLVDKGAVRHIDLMTRADAVRSPAVRALEAEVEKVAGEFE